MFPSRMVLQNPRCFIDTFAMSSPVLSEARVTTLFWKTVGGSLMPQAAQLWLALVYVHHIVSVSSEMLLHRDRLALLAFLSIHVSRLTCLSMGMLP